MPPQTTRQEKQTAAEAAAKPSTQPSRGFLSRWFGTDSFDPAQQKGIDIAKSEMPNMAPVQPYGFFSRLVHSGDPGYVAAGGNIYLNPAVTQGSTPQEIADILTHEQTHINQKKAEGYGPTMQVINSLLGAANRVPYQQRPEELEAYQAEKDRRARMGRPPGPTPDFWTGEMKVPRGDINLPAPRPARPSVNPSPGITIAGLNYK